MRRDVTWVFQWQPYAETIHRYIRPRHDGRLRRGATAYAPECEAQTNPVGIDTRSPRLSWKLKSESRGANQTAYQILVATSLDKLSESAADLWDSGRVASRESTWITYAGKPLRSFQQCWWKVRVWSDSGPGEWTQPALWTTSILDPKDRNASWISTASNALRSGPTPLYRKDFAVDKTVRNAILLVAGLGFHDVRVNGKPITKDVLAPAWTNYRNTVLYDAYDVTALIQTGKNAVGVMLGNGFYNVAGGRYAKYTGSFGVPRLWLQLHIEFADGSWSDITTNPSWRTHPGPLTFSCIYGGEDYDARLALEGWGLARIPGRRMGSACSQ